MQPTGEHLNEQARIALSRADPVLANLIAAHPGFDPRIWLADLPTMDAFGALVYQVIAQQLSAGATRRILERLTAMFQGALPTPAEPLAIELDELAKAGLRRKVATMREVAQRFADGQWREEEMRHLSDREIEDRLTSVSGVGPWTVHLIIALDPEDVVHPGDLALRNVIRRVHKMDHLSRARPKFSSCPSDGAPGGAWRPPTSPKQR